MIYLEFSHNMLNTECMIIILNNNAINFFPFLFFRDHSFIFFSLTWHFICSWLRPFVLLFCRTMFFFVGFHWITVRGRRVSCHEAPMLVVAPHSSYFDALTCVFMELTTVVAKAETLYAPIFGSMKYFLQWCLFFRLFFLFSFSSLFFLSFFFRLFFPPS